MKQYFYLQLKRLLRIFPMLVIGTLVTVTCVALLLGNLWISEETGADKQRVRIAIAGDTGSEYVQMGITALKTFDDTRFSMEIFELSEKEAQRQLQAGEISAYVVMPVNFIERALSGDVDTVTYVTHTGGEDIVSMFKDEVTNMITDIVVYSQKGVYAVGDVAAAEGARDVRGQYMDNLAFSYLELIFARSKICTVEELGISAGLSLLEYYISCLSVFLMLFIGVAFVTVGVRRDLSLQALLQSKGYGIHKQVLWEFVAHFLTLLCIAAILAGVVTLAGGQFLAGQIEMPGFTVLLLRLLPVVLVAAAINSLIFEWTDNVVSAVLWHFFLCLGQCYVSGCFYPVYTLPPVLQNVAGVLPAGLAREYVSGVFLGSAQWSALAGLFLYALLICGLTIGARWYRLRRDRR